MSIFSTLDSIVHAPLHKDSLDDWQDAEVWRPLGPYACNNTRFRSFAKDHIISDGDTTVFKIGLETYLSDHFLISRQPSHIYVVNGIGQTADHTYRMLKKSRQPVYKTQGLTYEKAVSFAQTQNPAPSRPHLS